MKTKYHDALKKQPEYQIEEGMDIEKNVADTSGGANIPDPDDIPGYPRDSQETMISSINRAVRHKRVDFNKETAKDRKSS